ncbi:MAG: TetR/AcrR family transcriptional regulator [Candidatus Krumholzibacteria bacterium]|nr:TetR/AcrR family transcriptional regulator [Candidatus Krumholzibacteria bacterium]
MDTRETLLRSAQKLFARFGFNKTTVDEIASAAHIAKSTLYHHFASKEEIFRAVIEREGKTLAERIRDAVGAADTPQDKLRTYVITRMGHLRELANFYSALRDEYLEHYPFIESVRQKDFEDEMAMFREILSDGVRKKVLNLKDGDVEVTALAVITALKGLEFPWTAQTGIADVNEHAEVLLRMLFHGILNPDT